jgi:flagellar biosynthesis/type III secretory pathway chaperone
MSVRANSLAHHLSSKIVVGQLVKKIQQNKKNIVTRLLIARQRVGKHIPAEANARNNRTSNARQRISKHASLTIEAVFSAWCLQSGYEEVFGSIEQYRSELRCDTPVCRDMTLGAEELN